MKLIPCLLAAAALAAAVSAPAAPLAVHSEGVFNAATPTTPFSAPGATWSFSFVVDSAPQPLLNDGLTSAGLFTTVPFTQFSFLLDGVPVAPALFVSLYNGANFGGMDLFFTDIVAQPNAAPSALTFFGPQLYAGPETSPTIVPGLYATEGPPGGGVSVAFDGVQTAQGAAVVAISAVPEPATALLWLGALGVFAALRRRDVTRQ